MGDIAIGSTLTTKDWFGSIVKAELPPPRTTQIHRVPMILKEHADHDKYYVPKVVALGPYHHGKPNLKSMEGFKPLYTNILLEGKEDSIRSLHNSLAQLVPILRGYYEGGVNHLSDDAFARMMLLDGCFILYIIKHIFSMNSKRDTLWLKSHQIMFIQEDMFLLENQIPYPVLTEVMRIVPYKDWDVDIKRFIDDNILAAERRRVKSRAHQLNDPIPTTTNHLLGLLQTRLTKDRSIDLLPNHRYTFRNVKELMEVGIRFKPSQTRTLARIKFTAYTFSANLQIPAITVDDSTKPILLNLVAYELCSNDHINTSWVTSYICLMDSLIDHSDDVKVLRKAGILDNRLGSDEEVAQLFNEIGKDLVPNSYVYSEAREAIQKHYDSKRNTWIRQLKHEYMKTPWAFIALVAGLMGLFLSSVQTYFSVWGSQSHCDSFCLYLKKHHVP
ncbi:hypothetical protein QVD17_15756 [Tagetes erecta]|uniref:Uncharacterized protein n=1 Tax=Tagetes erecta TaxID=13708 RepID=A0AAD8KSY8_TARER|nr:hypothetical protein QVD17_15756 [Tagetes erecta]